MKKVVCINDKNLPQGAVFYDTNRNDNYMTIKSSALDNYIDFKTGFFNLKCNNVNLLTFDNASNITFQSGTNVTVPSIYCTNLTTNRVQSTQCFIGDLNQNCFLEIGSSSGLRVCFLDFHTIP